MLVVDAFGVHQKILNEKTVFVNEKLILCH